MTTRPASTLAPDDRRPQRLIGLDLFRTLAVFGMLVAHVGPAAWSPDGRFGQVHWEWEVFHSRMPAMFAFAAGLSLNLSARRLDGHVREAAGMVVRAVLLLGCGLLLTALGTPVVVILGAFAAFFVLAIPFLRARTVPLLWAAGTWAVLGPPLSMVLRVLLPERTNPLWDLLVSGDYPALTWMPFVLAGVAIGRLDLAARAVRRRLALVGAALATFAYGGSALVMHLAGRSAIVASLPDQNPAEYASRFFAERGVTDTGSWWWLLSDAPHSGSWGDVLGALGTCILLLALLLGAGDRAMEADRSRGGRATRPLAIWLAAPGAMVLSVYALHIVAMWAITAGTGHSFAPSQPAWMLVAFVVGLGVFAMAWLRFRSQGPLELLMSRLTRLLLPGGRRGTRSTRGSSRR
ncbi:heparan-alpha-glucosaminide N-acetyltransferase domain-containing protein [Plantibacter sp. T3]|uniref:heparan-alpha-glucosaminide N-acetyltransferase domain-containing protein n=1 Tax=Plantibacter sp. T3 TaxID=2653161 RepID=UPI0012F4349F|nr:heparan-alpha-glucosaminide N-acetyltransferase domain-containing protein [Plantibacter sp. T3]VXC10419.1 Uncharacterized membrane protein [Plantibacter sp. T3]